MVWPWLLLSAAVVSGVAIILAVSICNYVKGGKTKTMPRTLVSLFFHHTPFLMALGDAALQEYQVFVSKCCFSEAKSTMCEASDDRHLLFILDVHVFSLF